MLLCITASSVHLVILRRENWVHKQNRQLNVNEIMNEYKYIGAPFVLGPRPYFVFRLIHLIVLGVGWYWKLNIPLETRFP